MGDMMFHRGSHIRRVMALAFVLALVGLVWAVPGAGTTAARAQGEAASAPRCDMVLFVGARGSGEKGPGDTGWKPTGKDPYGIGGTVVNAYNEFQLVLPGERTVQVVAVSYHAYAVQTLLHAPKQYFNDLSAGVNWTLAELAKQAKECPYQQIVLAGFSQGAMVMHRVIHSLGGTTSGRAVLARMTDAILIGDGDEVSSDNEQRYGSAALNARGIGQSLRKASHSSAAKFSTSLKARVLSVCNKHDLVCGWTDFNLACLTNPVKCLITTAEMIKIHLSYPGSKPLLAAADRAASGINPPPAIAVQVPLPADADTSADPPVVTGISCPGERRCTAVGYYTAKSGIQEAMLLSWSGAAWSVARSPLPADISGAYGELVAVSCPTNTFCAAVGSYANDTMLVTWSGGKWTATTVPVPPAKEFRTLDAISCPSSSYCVAVGDYSSAGVGLAMTWTGGKWSAAPIPFPGASGGQLNGVSCPTTFYCSAVGQYGDAAGGSLGLLAARSGGTWTTRTTPPAVQGASIVELLGVSCPAAGHCVLAGGYTSGSPMPQGLLLTQSGSSWKATTVTRSGGDYFPAVSCASTSHCVAVGASSSGQVLTWSGNSWSALSAPIPAHTFDYLDAISCPSKYYCEAGGQGVIVSLPS
jgi:Cutinase